MTQLPKSVLKADRKELILRGNPALELLPFDRLEPREKTMVADLIEDHGLFGVLRPKQGGTLKSVGPETALLLYSLREPGPLPTFFTGRANCHRDVDELILDGVLEIRADGEFVSGPQALKWISSFSAVAAKSPQGRLAQLTDGALRYAEALDLEDVHLLAIRLYRFNQLPLTPALCRLLHDEAAVRRFLSLAAVSRSAARDRWDFHASSTSGGWHSWQARADVPKPRSCEATYKLYISPPLERCREVLRELLAVLPSTRAFHCKVGSNAAGLARSDKMVAYFQDLDDLWKAGEMLTQRLDGEQPQGVPFTAEISGDGLLSWGMDPPRDERLLGWRGHESWRVWITQRLASALVQGKLAGDSEVSPRHFARERLRREGIDVKRWVPSASLWSAA